MATPTPGKQNYLFKNRAMQFPKQRMKIYRLSEMEPGERFYFATDKKKNVYSLDKENPFEKVRQKGFWIRYGYCYNLTHPATLPERHKDDRQVIFLRNT